MANPNLLDQIRSAYNAVAESYATALPDATFEAPLDLAMVEQFLPWSAQRRSAG